MPITVRVGRVTASHASRISRGQVVCRRLLASPASTESPVSNAHRWEAALATVALVNDVDAPDSAVGPSVVRPEIAHLAIRVVQNSIAAVVRPGTLTGAALGISVSAVVLALAEVAFFGTVDDAVAAETILALGRAGAVLGVVVECSVVAFFSSADDAVPAMQCPSLEQAVFSATVSRHGIAVVAGFRAEQDPIATNRSATSSRHPAPPVRFDFTVGRAAISIGCIAIVAPFGR